MLKHNIRKKEKLCLICVKLLNENQINLCKIKCKKYNIEENEYNDITREGMKIYACSRDKLLRKYRVNKLAKILVDCSIAKRYRRAIIRRIPTVYAGGSKLYFRSYGHTNCGTPYQSPPISHRCCATPISIISEIPESSWCT